MMKEMKIVAVIAAQSVVGAHGKTFWRSAARVQQDLKEGAKAVAHNGKAVAQDLKETKEEFFSKKYFPSLYHYETMQEKIDRRIVKNQKILTEVVRTDQPLETGTVGWKVQLISQICEERLNEVSKDISRGKEVKYAYQEAKDVCKSVQETVRFAGKMAKYTKEEIASRKNEMASLNEYTEMASLNEYISLPQAMVSKEEVSKQVEALGDKLASLLTAKLDKFYNECNMLAGAQKTEQLEKETKEELAAESKEVKDSIEEASKPFKELNASLQENKWLAVLLKTVTKQGKEIQELKAHNDGKADHESAEEMNLLDM